MVSDKQQQANEKNALLGGVKTEEGEEISKYNAVTHGIFRQSITDYEADRYSNILEDLSGEFTPKGITEELLVERIAILYIKLFRAQKAETEFMNSQLNPRITKPIIGEGWGEVVVNEGYTPKIGFGGIERLSTIYSRYETTIENKFYRAIHELQRLQALRNGKPLQDPAID